MGPEMNLNELQRSSKVGRIAVNIETTPTSTSGDVVLPMSTDIDVCALIAAAIENIDKVGPFDTEFKLISIEDVRAAKKDEIVRRAKEIKQRWATKTISEGESMINDVHQGDRARLTTYGPSNLTCSSGMDSSDWIILVEGRADVINLLRAGYDNAIAIEGAKIDASIKSLCESKGTVVAFLDGDRSGGFILKELKSLVRVDYELRADRGVEVEEMTPQRIDDILRPVAEEIKAYAQKPLLKNTSDKPLADVAGRVHKEINETLEAVALDSKEERIFRVPISEIVSKISDQSNIIYLMLDGIITQRLLDGARKVGVKYVVGHRVAKLTNSEGIVLRTFGELGIS